MQHLDIKSQTFTYIHLTVHAIINAVLPLFFSSHFFRNLQSCFVTIERTRNALLIKIFNEFPDASYCRDETTLPFYFLRYSNVERIDVDFT